MDESNDEPPLVDLEQLAAKLAKEADELNEQLQLANKEMQELIDKSKGTLAKSAALIEALKRSR